MIPKPTCDLLLTSLLLGIDGLPSTCAETSRPSRKDTRARLAPKASEELRRVLSGLRPGTLTFAEARACVQQAVSCENRAFTALLKQVARAFSTSGHHQACFDPLP